MSYAQLADVQARIPLFAISGTSRPNSTQVQGFLDQRAEEIDAAIRSRGIATPVTDAAWTTELLGLNAKAAAGDTMNAAFPSDAGPGSTALGPSLLREYNQRLIDIRRGNGIPIGVSVAEVDLAPRSDSTDLTVITEDDWQRDERLRPLFAVGRRF